MTLLRLKLVAAVAVLAASVAAPAAIVQTFADRASFAAAVSKVIALPLGLTGLPPVIVPGFTVGNLTLTAFDGALAGDGSDIISTEFDEDVLILDFATPQFGIGLFGGVVDEGFAFIDGELLVDVVGSGTAALISSGGPGYLGFISDVGFTEIRLSVTSFDPTASSVAFAGLQQQVDQAGTVPEPATWSLLLAGFAAVGGGLRSRRALAAT